MYNYKIVLQYEGTRYQGWQRQDKTENTIQGKLERILSIMTGYTVEVDGSGRTDAGVHALGQVANFKLKTSEEPSEIMRYMNQYLPEDIAVLECQEVPERFHSRLNCVGKTYCYQIWNESVPNVFERKYSWQIDDKLQLEAMKEAAELLLGTHDFQAFTSAKSGKKSTVRTIDAIEFTEDSKMVAIHFHGDGFLYHMVRIITGTLVEIGLGKRTPQEITDILQRGERSCAGLLAPAQGLFLVRAEYR